jgi:hypothetical protein
VGVGVGRRGRTETWLEIHTGLVRDAEAAWLWLLFSAEALGESGTLARLLGESRKFAGLLAEGLRDRIYEEVVPRLSEGLAAARRLRNPSPQDLAETYEMAMTVLFRLLFIAYGEDKNLLPYEWNDAYRGRSLKRKAQEILELHRAASSAAKGDGRQETGDDDAGSPSPVSRSPSPVSRSPSPPARIPWDKSDSLWEEVSRLFRAVEGGQREWGVPAYDGGLFTADPEVSRSGALLAETSLPNTVMGPVLEHLLLIGTPEGLGPVDFRSLSVREFGTIYEGLLESELSVAETDLATDDNGFYRPAKPKDELKVEAGHIYLHNRSGARKASGSYFTKEFAVEHLLDRALEPALAEHLARVDALADDDAAAAALFDFRVADIAMGSGHFLVAAVDRIERGMASYLARRPLPGVRGELLTLQASAKEAFGNLGELLDERLQTSLLRRLIARRCIYGVDLNPSRCSSRGSRSGFTRSSPACRSRCSTTTSFTATLWSASAG